MSLIPAFEIGLWNASVFEKYGDAHQEYMNKTPRWIGIPKSRKSN